MKPHEMLLNLKRYDDDTPATTMYDCQGSVPLSPNTDGKYIEYIVAPGNGGQYVVERLTETSAVATWADQGVIVSQDGIAPVLVRGRRPLSKVDYDECVRLAKLAIGVVP